MTEQRLQQTCRLLIDFQWQLMLQQLLPLLVEVEPALGRTAL
jgi:hypothetical protein